MFMSPVQRDLRQIVDMLDIRKMRELALKPSAVARDTREAAPQIVPARPERWDQTRWNNRKNPDLFALVVIRLLITAPLQYKALVAEPEPTTDTASWS